MALLSTPSTPPVFPGLPFPIVNGALYTIAYEFRCYLLVALLGVCGLLRRPVICLAVAVFLLPSLLYARLHWPGEMEALAGHVVGFRLTAVFLVGSGFYLFRHRVPFRPWLALGAAVLLTAVFVFARARAEVALVLCGGYLMFYLGHLRLSSLSWMSRFPDISYGIYLYGWPVESLWIWYRRGSPWITFLVSTIICFALGWLSWQLIERPALALKRRPTAPLPGG